MQSTFCKCVLERRKGWGEEEKAEDTAVSGQGKAREQSWQERLEGI